MTVALYRAVGSVLAKQGFEATLVGDEGGYGPRLRDNEQAFAVVVDAIRLCGFEPGRDVAIAVDVASSHFFDRGDWYLSPGHGQRSRAGRRGHGRAAGRLGRSFPDRFARGRTGRRRLGRMGRTHGAAGEVRSAHRRRPFRHADQPASNWDRARRGQRHPDQAQPGRDAHGDVRRDRACPRARVSERWFRLVRARRKMRRSRTLRLRRVRARSRSDPWRGPSVWPSTIGCSGSRKSSARSDSWGTRELFPGIRDSSGTPAALLTTVGKRWGFHGAC